MLKTGQNEGMEAEEAETFVNHLMKTYDKNNDGRFDYAGMDYYFQYILIGHFMKSIVYKSWSKDAPK